MSGAAARRAAIAPVGVVVPVRDYVQFIREALRSVIGQVPAPAQVVVVDDGSSDGSGAAAAAFDGVEVIRQDAMGIAAAVARGVEQITQPLLAFVDADDRWPAGSLASRLAALEEASDRTALFGRTRHFHSPELTAEERARFPLPPVRPGRLRGAMLIGCEVYRSVVQPVDEVVGSGEFVDWSARAEEAGIEARSLEAVALERRIHRGHIDRPRTADPSYARIVHAALRRRRGVAR